MIGRSRGQWCGPTALAVVTRRDYAEALADLKEIKRKTRPDLRRVRVAGVEVSLLDKALKGRAPGTVRTVLPRKGIPLRQWLKGPQRQPERFQVLHLTGHYITIWGESWIDNWEEPKGPRTLTDCRWLRTRLRSFWTLPY